MSCNHEWGGVVIPGPVNRVVIDQCENCGELRLPDAARQPGAQVPVVCTDEDLLGELDEAADHGATLSVTYLRELAKRSAAALRTADPVMFAHATNLQAWLEVAERYGDDLRRQLKDAAAPAQGIDLGKVREIRIPARNNLDPISVFVQDQAAGRGRIVVTCYGNAWQAFWGAMGNRTVMEFVAQCDADYVAGNMLQGRQTRIAKHERAYTERIAAEVIAEFRTLIDQRDAAPGVGQ